MLLLVTHHMGQEQNNVKFVNMVEKLSDDIRMVLPLSFKKVSIQNKVSLDISVVEEGIYQRILSLTVSGQCINAGQRLAFESCDIY